MLALLSFFSFGCAGEDQTQATTSDTAPTSRTQAVAGEKVETDLGTVAGGDQHTCVVTATRHVSCWGANASGELGRGFAGSERGAPALVKVTPTAYLSSVKKVVAGRDHTCALRTNGSVYCWGRGRGGKLGNGSTGNSSYAVQVRDANGPLLSALDIASGRDHACAIVDQLWWHAVSCWGDNAYGQLDGQGPTDSSLARTVNPGGQTWLYPELIAAGDYHTCIVRSDTNRVFCWGRNSKRQLGSSTTSAKTGYVSYYQSSSDPAVGISAGADHTCVVTEQGRGHCWGANSNGQLAANSTSTSAGASIVRQSNNVMLANLRSVAAGGNRTCFTRNSAPVLSSPTVSSFYFPIGSPSGTLYCAGDNGSGAVATGSWGTSIRYARQVTNLISPASSGVASLGLGRAHTCATRHDSSSLEQTYVDCIGSNTKGQVQDSPLGQFLSWQRIFTDEQDKDGIPDSSDNCPEVANRDQDDYDADGVGDACECDGGPCGPVASWSSEASIQVKLARPDRVEFSWPPASTVAPGVRHYHIEQDGQRIATRPGSATSHTIVASAEELFVTGRRYSLEIIAVDEVGRVIKAPDPTNNGLVGYFVPSNVAAPNAGSCANICGYSAETCFCDDGCQEAGDCCDDYQQFCEGPLYRATFEYTPGGRISTVRINSSAAAQ